MEHAEQAEPRQEITMDQALAHLREERQAETPPEEAGQEPEEAQPEQPPERQPDEGRPVYANEREALTAMQRAEEAQAEPEPVPQPKPEPEPEPPIVPADARWSDAEVAEHTQINAAFSAWQQQAAQFGQARQQAEQRLRQGELDMGQAEALKHQLRDTERSLREQYEGLQERAQKLNGSATKRSQTAQQQRLDAERAKLQRAMPNIDVATTRKYLQGQGFSDADINGLTDHRAVAIVEKARLYDALVKEQKAGGRGGRVPKLRQGAGRGGEPDAGPMVRDFQGKQMPLSQLQAQVKRHGRLEDAAALLTAKRRAAQQQQRGR